MRCRLYRWVIAALVLTTSLGAGAALAQGGGSVAGAVVDPTGARVAGATVALVRDGQIVAQTTSDGRGEFVFQAVSSGRYAIEARAGGFEPHTTDPIFVGSSGRVTVDLRLSVGPLRQEIAVTAAATEAPVSQIGAPVTVLDAATIEVLGKPDVPEVLRLVPGAQVVRTGARGSVTSVFIRGGNANFTKLLIDGVPANDIGGFVDFSAFSTSGVERVEVLRQTNSVLNGADALAGIVDITTRRGRTRLPELQYSIDGGSLGTLRTGVSGGGAVRRLDYFSEYSHADTDNDLPNNAYRNRTFAGRVGLALGHGTDLTGTVRRIDTRFESPNAIDLFAVPDDSFQTGDLTFVGVGARSQLNDRWQSSVRLGWTELASYFENPTPTGEAFDPFGFGANYLGDTVTVRGANGFSTTGRAILDFGGPYPSTFDSRSRRRSMYAQTSYSLRPALSLAGGGHFEREEGFEAPDAGPTTVRNNGGLFVEGRGTVGGRHHVIAGLGYEHNTVFKSAYTPRLSVASYLRNPSATAFWGDTKVTFNAGKGIKAPSVFQQQSSLFTLLQSTALASAVSTIGPERSRSLDVGVEQGLWGGRTRLRVSYFDNEFFDLIEFVSSAILPQFGVSPAAAAASGFGAYVNSQSYRARGVETSVEAAISRQIRVSGSYTYLDATVTKSLSDGVLQPAVNPAFPGIRIGAYSPLVGERPFRRPPHLASLLVAWTDGPAQVSLAGSFAGRADDSTFLSDSFFGSSMLLPNRDLNAGYQKVDVSGSYRLHARLRWYARVENALDQQYHEAFGFPALPRTIRTGVTVTIGGEGGRRTP